MLRPTPTLAADATPPTSYGVGSAPTVDCAGSVGAV